MAMTRANPEKGTCSSQSRRRGPTRLVLSCFAAVAVVVFAAGIPTTAAGGDPFAYAPIGKLTPRISPQAALRRSLHAMEGTAIASASLGKADYRPSIRVTVRLPPGSSRRDSAARMEAYWEADLLVGAIAEQSATDPDMSLSFGRITYDAELPGGGIEHGFRGAMGVIRRGQTFTTISDAEIRAHVLAVLSGRGLKLVQLRVFRPLGPAPAVVAVASRPYDFQELQDALFKKPYFFEGFYLEIRDSDGVPLKKSSASFRTGSGRAWPSGALIPAH
jgi:hypothetical protein